MSMQAHDHPEGNGVRLCGVQQAAGGDAGSAVEMMKLIEQMTALLRGLNMNLKAAVAASEDGDTCTLEANTAVKAFHSARECHSLARGIPQTLSQTGRAQGLGVGVGVGEGFESTCVLLRLHELQACISNYLEHSIAIYRRAAPKEFSKLVQELLATADAVEEPRSAVEEGDVEVLCKVRWCERNIPHVRALWTSVLISLDLRGFALGLRRLWVRFKDPSTRCSCLAAP